MDRKAPAHAARMGLPGTCPGAGRTRPRRRARRPGPGIRPNPGWSGNRPGRRADSSRKRCRPSSRRWPISAASSSMRPFQRPWTSSSTAVPPRRAWKAGRSGGRGTVGLGAPGSPGAGAAGAATPAGGRPGPGPASLPPSRPRPGLQPCAGRDPRAGARPFSMQASHWAKTRRATRGWRMASRHRARTRVGAPWRSAMARSVRTNSRARKGWRPPRTTGRRAPGRRDQGRAPPVQARRSRRPGLQVDAEPVPVDRQALDLEVEPALVVRPEDHLPGHQGLEFPQAQGEERVDADVPVEAAPARRARPRAPPVSSTLQASGARIRRGALGPARPRRASCRRSSRSGRLPGLAAGAPGAGGRTSGSRPSALDAVGEQEKPAGSARGRSRTRAPKATRSEAQSGQEASATKGRMAPRANSAADRICPRTNSFD